MVLLSRLLGAAKRLPEGAIAAGDSLELLHVLRSERLKDIHEAGEARRFLCQLALDNEVKVGMGGMGGARPKMVGGVEVEGLFDMKPSASRMILSEVLDWDARDQPFLGELQRETLLNRITDQHCRPDIVQHFPEDLLALYSLLSTTGITDSLNGDQLQLHTKFLDKIAPSCLSAILITQSRAKQQDEWVKLQQRASNIIRAKAEVLRGFVNDLALSIAESHFKIDESYDLEWDSRAQQTARLSAYKRDDVVKALMDPSLFYHGDWYATINSFNTAPGAGTRGIELLMLTDNPKVQEQVIANIQSNPSMAFSKSSLTTVKYFLSCGPEHLVKELLRTLGRDLTKVLNKHMTTMQEAIKDGTAATKVSAADDAGANSVLLDTEGLESIIVSVAKRTSKLVRTDVLLKKAGSDREVKELRALTRTYLQLIPTLLQTALTHLEAQWSMRRIGGEVVEVVEEEAAREAKLALASFHLILWYRLVATKVEGKANQEVREILKNFDSPETWHTLVGACVPFKEGSKFSMKNAMRGSQRKDWPACSPTLYMKYLIRSVEADKLKPDDAHLLLDVIADTNVVVPNLALESGQLVSKEAVRTLRSLHSSIFEHDLIAPVWARRLLCATGLIEESTGQVLMPKTPPGGAGEDAKPQWVEALFVTLGVCLRMQDYFRAEINSVSRSLLPDLKHLTVPDAIVVCNRALDLDKPYVALKALFSTFASQLETFRPFIRSLMVDEDLEDTHALGNAEEERALLRDDADDGTKAVQTMVDQHEEFKEQDDKPLDPLLGEDAEMNLRPYDTLSEEEKVQLRDNCTAIQAMLQDLTTTLPMLYTVLQRQPGIRAHVAKLVNLAHFGCIKYFKLLKRCRIDPDLPFSPLHVPHPGIAHCCSLLRTFDKADRFLGTRTTFTRMQIREYIKVCLNLGNRYSDGSSPLKDMCYEKEIHYDGRWLSEESSCYVLHSKPRKRYGKDKGKEMPVPDVEFPLHPPILRIPQGEKTVVLGLKERGDMFIQPHYKFTLGSMENYYTKTGDPKDRVEMSDIWKKLAAAETHILSQKEAIKKLQDFKFLVKRHTYEELEVFQWQGPTLFDARQLGVVLIQTLEGQDEKDAVERPAFAKTLEMLVRALAHPSTTVDAVRHKFLFRAWHGAKTGMIGSYNDKRRPLNGPQELHWMLCEVLSLFCNHRTLFRKYVVRVQDPLTRSRKVAELVTIAEKFLMWLDTESDCRHLDFHRIIAFLPQLLPYVEKTQNNTVYVDMLRQVRWQVTPLIEAQTFVHPSSYIGSGTSSNVIPQGGGNFRTGDEVMIDKLRKKGEKINKTSLRLDHDYGRLTYQMGKSQDCAASQMEVVGEYEQHSLPKYVPW